MLKCGNWSTETGACSEKKSCLSVSSALLTHNWVYWGLLAKGWLSPSDLRAESCGLGPQQASLSWCHGEWANCASSILLMLLWQWYRCKYVLGWTSLSKYLTTAVLVWSHFLPPHIIASSDLKQYRLSHLIVRAVTNWANFQVRKQHFHRKWKLEAVCFLCLRIGFVFGSPCQHPRSLRN